MGCRIAGGLEIPHGHQEIHFEETRGAAGDPKGVAPPSQAGLPVAAGGLDAQRDERPVFACTAGAANPAAGIFQARSCAPARGRTLKRAQKPLRNAVAHAGPGTVAQKFYGIRCDEGSGQFRTVSRERCVTIEGWTTSQKACDHTLRIYVDLSTPAMEALANRR